MKQLRGNSIMDMISILELTASLVVFPLVGLVTWVLKGIYKRISSLEDSMQVVDKQQAVHDRLFKRIEHLERNVTHIDKAQAVQGAQLADIKTDIHQINKKLDKIIDKLVG